eukprot:747317-Hanusia_phi.AAC.2
MVSGDGGGGARGSDEDMEDGDLPMAGTATRNSDEEQLSEEERANSVRGKRKRASNRFHDEDVQSDEDMSWDEESTRTESVGHKRDVVNDDDDDDFEDDKDGGGGIGKHLGEEDENHDRLEENDSNEGSSVVPDKGQECVICEAKFSTEENLMLLCDGCDQGYHAWCLDPQNGAKDCIAMKEWYCDSCKGEMRGDQGMLQRDVSKREVRREGNMYVADLRRACASGELQGKLPRAAFLLRCARYRDMPSLLETFSLHHPPLPSPLRALSPRILTPWWNK